ncbi:MAG: GtrA family protein, partial [Patescibacteria group bacterium]
LLERNEGKAGRGSACLAGFRIARERDYKAAIEMDADLSHDPKDIPRFLAQLSGADVVIGSKYVPGSRIIGWEWYRKVLSRAANLYAGLILRLPVHDYTNGYRCYGERALAHLPELQIEGTGFTVIPQMSYELHRLGMRLTEIPITFTNRRHGTSNMSLREMRESFLAILHIRSRSLALHVAQGAKFVTTGLTNSFIDFGILAFCVEVLAWPLLFSNVLSTGIAVTNAFYMNKRWTFKNEERKHAVQYAQFILVYGSSFFLAQGILWFFAIELGFWYVPVKLLIIPGAAAWNYLWMHHAVFRERKH